MRGGARRTARSGPPPPPAPRPRVARVTCARGGSAGGAGRARPRRARAFVSRACAALTPRPPARPPPPRPAPRAPAEADEIPLNEIKAAILIKVIEFMKHHVDTKLPEIEKPLKSANLADFVPEWDAKFVDLDQETLFELVLAANYMDIKSLLDLSCAKVASLVKGKTPEEIRKTFNIKNDFTPEEEAQVIEENKWISGASRAARRGGEGRGGGGPSSSTRARRRLTRHRPPP